MVQCAIDATLRCGAAAQEVFGARKIRPLVSCFCMAAAKLHAVTEQQVRLQLETF